MLGSILSALKSIVNVIGMTKMTPPIKDLLPRLTPILKNRSASLLAGYKHALVLLWLILPFFLSWTNQSSHLINDSERQHAPSRQDIDTFVRICAWKAAG